MFSCKNILYKNPKLKKTVGYLLYSKCSDLHQIYLTFCLGKGSKQQLGFSSDAACQASQDRGLWKIGNKRDPYCGPRALPKNVQTPVPRAELKLTSVTCQSWLGETGHLHSVEFSSKGIWREKNLKAAEDLHNSSVQYNLCFMWENYLRLRNSLLISQTWGMSSRSGCISLSFQQKRKTCYCKR